MWNLSLFRMHCLDLPLEFLCRGFHHPEDPGVSTKSNHFILLSLSLPTSSMVGILSLSFHQRTTCFFSGGVDGIIKYILPSFPALKSHSLQLLETPCRQRAFETPGWSLPFFLCLTAPLSRSITKELPSGICRLPTDFSSQVYSSGLILTHTSIW